MDDQIHVLTPRCGDCTRPAVGFIRWTPLDEPNVWWPKCERYAPWYEPDAVIVGIRHITVDLDDSTRQWRPQPDKPPTNDDEFRAAYLRAAAKLNGGAQ